MGSCRPNIFRSEAGGCSRRDPPEYEDKGNPYYATTRLWDEGLIDAAETRDLLGLVLAVTLNAPIAGRAQFGLFRM